MKAKWRELLLGAGFVLCGNGWLEGAGVKADAGAGVIHGNASYTLYADRIVEGTDTAWAYRKGDWLGLTNARGEMVRPFLREPRPELESGTAMLDCLYHVALADFEMNQVDDHFRVSPDFHYNMFFTRDIAYSSVLGANYAFARQIKSHLRACRVLRREVGFITGTGQQIPIASITPLETVEPLDNTEFFEKYSTHPYSRRTDDICWIPGYWEAMKVDLADGELEWFVREFEYFDGTFYRHFLDPADNLYLGQASFIDVGGTGYPGEFSAQDSILSKALSTNAVYHGAFRILEEAYRLLGEGAKAQAMAQRADRLGVAIRREFRMPDGHYAYLKRPDGRLEPRREQLGCAFLVLYGVLDPVDFQAAVGDYPGNDFGNPLLVPFFPTRKVYHNNAIWPFANTLFNLAEFRADPRDDTLLRTLGNLSRHALQGNFGEVLDYKTGGREVKHARSYTWSAASFMAMAYRFIFGLDVRNFDTLVIRPQVPEVLGGRHDLAGLVVQGTRIDVQLRGHGTRVAQVLLDGREAALPEVPLDGGEHVIEIQLQPAAP